MGRVLVDCFKAPTGYDLSCCCRMHFCVGQRHLLGILSCHTNMVPHYALCAWRSWEADKLDRPDAICRECRPVEYSVCRTYKAKTDSRAAGFVPEQWSSGAVAVCVSCPLQSLCICPSRLLMDRELETHEGIEMCKHEDHIS